MALSTTINRFSRPLSQPATHGGPRFGNHRPADSPTEKRSDPLEDYSLGTLALLLLAHPFRKMGQQIQNQWTSRVGNWYRERQARQIIERAFTRENAGRYSDEKIEAVDALYPLIDMGFNPTVLVRLLQPVLEGDFRIRQHFLKNVLARLSVPQPQALILTHYFDRLVTHPYDADVVVSMVEQWDPGFYCDFVADPRSQKWSKLWAAKQLSIHPRVPASLKQRAKAMLDELKRLGFTEEQLGPSKNRQRGLFGIYHDR